MKVIYVPFNNKGFKIPDDVSTIIIEDIYTYVTQPFVNGSCHVGPNDKAKVLFYLSCDNDDINKSLFETPTPDWVDDLKIVFSDSFSVSDGDRLAEELSNYNSSDVICFRLMPSTLLTREEIDRAVSKEKDKWGWACDIEVPWYVPSTATTN